MRVLALEVAPSTLPSTPLRLASCAGRKSFFEEGDAGGDGVGLAVQWGGGTWWWDLAGAGPAPGGEQVGQGGRPIWPARSGGPSGRMPVAVVTRSAAVCSKMVKLIRSVSKPGRVGAGAAEEGRGDG